MVALHTLLHPTDFSERSDFAFHLACALARDHGARMIIMHVSQPPLAIYTEGAIPPGLEDYREELHSHLLQVRPPEGIQASHRLEEGNPVEEILRVAQESQAELIVMGTHGRRGWKRLLMGSVAEMVMRRASCPVLTVKTPFPPPEAATLHAEEALAMNR